MIIGYLFAYTQSLSLTWSGLGMPGQLIEMLPYVMVILVMVFTKWKNIKHRWRYLNATGSVVSFPAPFVE